MTDPRTPARRLLPLLLAVLVVLSAAAGGRWLGAARPVPPDELVRADAWQGTQELLAHPSLGAGPEVAGVRADLERQLEALGPAPGDRAASAARAGRSSPAAPGGAGSAGGPGDLAGVLSASGMELAGDALRAEEPALARVLGATAASRAVTARQLGGAGPELCAPGAAGAPGPGGTSSPGALLWSALDRAGYALEALAARAGPAPAAGPAAPLLLQAREDVEELLELPAARGVLAAAPGLRAGAYVLPGDAAESPARAAGAVAQDVQAAAAHALAHGQPADRCWALLALERAGELRAGLGGEVDALPGVLADDDARGRAPR
ncbi:hypothetical protein [Kocuria sabuli]|uniref:hypothetical protein n=1 Tax=Kocuria sabuli TaxID=3071448 RepID=UPI0034D54B72